ncbi:hypothetical protein vBVpaMR16F_186 [Vibrio phage vB_VpaM_R16F]|nr:hypothetical protein vBVpaMR16F_186 [Vibrio phage vB_VpaM_R16F]
MKSLDKIIDDLWKPESLHTWLDEIVDYRLYTRLDMYREYRYNNGLYNKERSKLLIGKMYEYSREIIKPHYGKDINEPVFKICSRILSEPKRFNLINTEYDVRDSYSENIYEYNVTNFLKKYVIEDKGTKQKFVIEEKGVVYPTCFNQDESILLRYVFDAWYVSYAQELISKREEKRKVREQKRKDKFRQELTDLYKDL